MKRTKKTVVDDSFKIISFDPSMTAWGWSVINANDKIYATGCIKTEPKHKKTLVRKGDDTVRRVGIINTELLWAIEKYKVNMIITEQPHGSQSASAAVMIGICIGMVKTMAQALKLPVEWYSEADAKQATMGKQSGTKLECIQAIDFLYDVPVTNTKKYNTKAPWSGKQYIDEAVADSLAVHYAASKLSTFLQHYKNG